ncbi:MAG: pyridoxal phosphate-dependent aminotransferase [Oligoflexia bacterium]|nr:pyridoxal phosphate-dependent aminotransferase [Oligoflexia bacterium]
MKSLANRIHNIEESKSVKLAGLLSKLRKEGRDIIGLNVGEPDFTTPDRIIKATKEALDANHTRYSLVEGIHELREAIAKKVGPTLNRELSESQIFLGNGSKHILYNIFQTILNTGDEVIVPKPYWVTFPESIKLAQGTPVFVDCPKNQLSIENIERAITSKTKAIIINSPNNPTGAVYPREALEELAKLVIEKDLFLISDEAYDALVFDDIQFTSPASISDEMFKRTLTVQSFSKSYCMTGFRIGYLIADEVILKGMQKLQSHLSGNNCTFAQYGALEAIHSSDEIVKDMISKMESRRNIAYELCKELFEVEKPEGAFYLFPNVEKYLSDEIPNDEVLAEKLLLETGVALLPGTYFGSPGYIRICFATNEEEIKEGFKRMKEFLCK